MSSFLLLQFDLLQQLGFEGYAILINTNELQSHLIATHKGKNFHRIKQKQGKPLENPFIGFIFSEGAGGFDCYELYLVRSFVRIFIAFSILEEQLPRLDQLAHLPRAPPPALGLDTLQKSVMNAFSLKFSECHPITMANPSNLSSICNMSPLCRQSVCLYPTLPPRGGYREDGHPV